MFRFLFNLIMIAFIVFVGGFLWFVFDVPAAKSTEKVDAAVVLTGGKSRIEKGLEILRADNTGLVYISGVNDAITPVQLQQSYNITADEMKCCIVTDQSENTRGNAATTARWIEENNVRTLQLITSSYHMRRSLLEFRSLLPETVILPTPVSVESVFGAEWWKDKAIWEQIGQEYLKYLVVQFRQFQEAFGKKA